MVLRVVLLLIFESVAVSTILRFLNTSKYVSWRRYEAAVMIALEYRALLWLVYLL